MREVAAGEWDALLAELGCADAYYLQAYAAASCVLDPGKPVLLHVEDVVMSCIVRPIAGSDRYDVTTPYGYGGPVGVGAEPPGIDFYEQYEDWCARGGVVSTFIRFHPRFANRRQAAASVQLEHSGSTAGWRLGDGRDLFAGMHRSHRNKCRKARGAGVQVAVTPHPEDLAEFATLYDTTMHRQQATNFYFFPPVYWERLTALGDRLVRFDAAIDGQVVASALCLRDDHWLHYHLSATDDSARDLGASNLLLYEAAQWAQDQGLEEFHLGGGAGGDTDSLFAFKQRFSPGGEREFWVGKLVHDEGAYRRLCGGAEIDYDGFFPAYRVPGALSHTAGTPRSA